MRLRFLIACAPVLLQSCLVSPLSEPLQAGELRVNIDVIQERNEHTGAVRTSLEARFYDKMDQRVKLGDGAVYVGGQKMNAYTAFFGETYYRLSGAGVAFAHDSVYVFRIVIDDVSGEAHECMVRTQARGITASSLQIAGDTARISWLGDSSGVLRVNYVLQRTVGGTTETMLGERTFLPPHTGPLHVPLEGYTDLAYSLESVVEGTVSPAFRAGSIESMVRLVR